MDQLKELAVSKEAEDQPYLKSLYSLNPFFMTYQYALRTLKQSVYNNIYLRYIHYERVSKLLALTIDANRILDVGCGYGTLSLELANKGKHVVLLDLDRKALLIAKYRFGRFGLNYESIRGDACHLPFRENSFDASYSNQVIEHVSCPGKMMLEQLRISTLRVIVVGGNTSSAHSLPILHLLYFRLLRRRRSENEPDIGSYDEKYYINPKVPLVNSRIAIVSARIIASLPYFGKLLAGQTVKVYHKKECNKVRT